MKTIDDYERAIYYVMWGDFDPLMLLMCRTKDDVLAKRIQIFLHRYYYSPNNEEVLESHDNLLNYIDHAMQQTNDFTIQI